MSIRRYKSPLIVFAVIIVMVLIISVILSIFLPTGFLNFSPIDNAGFNIFFLLLIAIISSLIGAVLPGYILAPLILLLHKYTIGFKMDYGIQTRKKSEKFSDLFKGFFPSLMAINFALALSNNEVIQIAIMGTTSTSSIFIQIMTFNVLSMIMIGVSLTAFSTVWFLLDGGIVYTNKRKVKNKSNPIEVRAVGSWLYYLLKGYAGISVIFSYYQFISGEIFTSIDISTIIFYSTWPFFPIVFTFFT
ncbi:MAG: hypothetical protein GF317_21765, partial [Candidatus Lokiarchaeota archaeon]|nr:hypothetical protein [Candidatus Lokiarchaeota archaeon]MBD3202089.1 hypothetical protein [Candidatus Lokiarchaeota archaeon]